MLFVHYLLSSVELLFYGKRLKCQIVFDRLLCPSTNAYYNVILFCRCTALFNEIYTCKPLLHLNKRI